MSSHTQPKILFSPGKWIVIKHQDLFLEDESDDAEAFLLTCKKEGTDETISINFTSYLGVPDMFVVKENSKGEKEVKVYIL